MSKTESVQHWLEQPGVGEILACAAAALFYVATLAFGFVYDDIPQIVSNPAIRAWNSVPQYFTAHVWSAIYPNTAGNYYRPLFLVWLRLNYAIFVTNPWGWHLSSVLCHVVATALVLRLALKLTTDRMTAFFCALIFALHPAHVENVAWVSGVTDSLATCFLLGSILLLLTAEHRMLWRIGSLVLFALALLSKEVAIILPIFLFVFGLLAKERNDSTQTSRLSHAVRLTLPYVLVLLAYVVARYFALHGWSQSTIPLKWTQVLLTWPSVLWFYTRHLLFPFRTSEFYSLDYVSHFSIASVLWPLVLGGASISAVWFLMRSISGADERSKVVTRISWVLIILPLIPILDLRSLTAGDIVHDRYLYLSSVGLSLMIAIAIRVLLRDRLVLQVVAVGAIATFLGGVTVAEQMQWRDDVALYTRGIESAPNNLTVRDNLGNALLDKHPEKAVPLYLEVLKRNPRFWRSNYNLGLAYYKLGEYQKAEACLQQAIRIDPSDGDEYIYLALSEVRLQKLQQAKQYAESAIARNPNGRGYHAVLGTISEMTGDRENAIRELHKEISLHPDNLPAAAELKRLTQRSSANR